MDRGEFEDLDEPILEEGATSNTEEFKTPRQRSLFHCEEMKEGQRG